MQFIHIDVSRFRHLHLSWDPLGNLTEVIWSLESVEICKVQSMESQVLVILP